MKNAKLKKAKPAAKKTTTPPRRRITPTSKEKSNASWHQLSSEQRKTLETWLFDEKLGYEKSLARARREFDFTGSRSAIVRFYQRAKLARLTASFAASRATGTAIGRGDVSTAALCTSSMKVIAQLLLQQVTDSPENVKQWHPLARLVLHHQQIANWQRLRDDEIELRRAYFHFSRTRFEYDNIENALDSLPQLLDLNDARKDPKVRKFEENKKMNDLRKSMFGEIVPELLPENEEEEAHPEIIEQRLREAELRPAVQMAEQIRAQYPEKARELDEYIARERAKPYGPQPLQPRPPMPAPPAPEPPEPLDDPMDDDDDNEPGTSDGKEMYPYGH